MPALSTDRIASLLVPYVTGEGFRSVPETLYEQLQCYLDLLLRWNASTNLTAIREPEEIVRRHFGESLFAGQVLHPLAPIPLNLLDFGSGAGFPGVPIQLLHPGLAVTLAESQGKKAAFLREACRTLQLPTQVFGGRVEAMPAALGFDVVTLRAVDKMEAAMKVAEARVRPGGVLASLGVAAVPVGAGIVQHRIPGASEVYVRFQRFL